MLRYDCAVKSMAEPSERAPSGGRMLLIAVVVSALVGAGTGFTAGFLARPQPTPQVREFWVFSVVLPFNDTMVGLSHDYFAPDRIVVNRGDTVTIHFYNTEDAPERHTFTMDAPYSVNKDLAMGEEADINFVASMVGTFAYRCTYHQPTMTGYLVVLG